MSDNKLSAAAAKLKAAKAKKKNSANSPDDAKKIPSSGEKDSKLAEGIINLARRFKRED